MTPARALEILQAFQPWPGPSRPEGWPQTSWKSQSARQVRESLASRGLRKTGIHLNRLVELGLLERWTHGKTTLYRPTFPPGSDLQKHIERKLQPRK